MDFLRPKENALMPEGASTTSDLTPRDNTAAVARHITKLVLHAEAFALDRDRVVVAKKSGVQKYPIPTGNRMEGILAALELAAEDL